MTPPIPLGLFGLALGHPLSFAECLSRRGLIPSFLAYDETQPEETERAGRLLARWPELRRVPDAAAMISEGAGAVLCSSQAHRHDTDCAPFIEARVPLYIDKPMAPDYPRARRLLDLVETFDAPVMSCSVRRFSVNYQALIEQVREGRAGTVLFVECFEPHGVRPGYWQDRKESSGGLAVNYGVHVADPIVSALGTAVRSVYAVASKNALPGAESEDTALMLIQFEGGAAAVGKVSGGYAFGRGEPVPTVGHLIVHGSRAALETHIDESDIKVYRGGNFGVTDSYGARSGSRGALEAFERMARTGKRPIPVEHMDAVMKILDGARRSIDTGEPVRWPPREPRGA